MKRIRSKTVFLTTVSIGLISMLSSTALLLASCSATSDEDTRIDKGDGNLFADNEKTGDDKISVTLQEVAMDSLFNESSMTKNIQGRIGDIFYKAIEIISESNATFARDLTNQNKEIEEDLKKTKEQLQKSNSSKWKEEFQDLHLDPNGGTEESFISIKKNEWAITYLTDKIFQKSLVVVKNGSKTIRTPQLSDLMNALNTSGWSFAWEGENQLENELYAPIQEFVFKKWLEFEKPMIVNMSLWKYGAPQGGINSIYNSNITPPPEEENPEGEEEGSTFSTRNSELAGNYSFPFFSESADNETFSSIEKFNNFIEGAKNTSNYIIPTIAGVTNNAGLIDVPQNHTEDSSTYILAKASNIYDTLFPEFAMATLSLYYNKFYTGDNELLTAPNTRNINTNASVLDDITKQFISTNEFLNANSAKIPSNMVNKIINQFGNLTSLRGADLYSSDAFKVADPFLSNFMMLRNEAGVHAIAIDGYKHIESITNQEEANQKYGDVIIYRHLLSERDLTNFAGNNNLSINLQTELKTYFNDNKEFILKEMFTNREMETLVSKYFNNNYINSGTNASKNFYIAISDYLFNMKNVDKNINVQNKFRSTKESYSSNFGANAKNNGLAAPWIYKQNTSTGFYNITNLYKEEKPVYGPAVGSVTSYREDYLNAAEKYITSLSLSPLSSTDETFEFSQLIYSDDFYMNLSIYDYMKNNGSIFGDKIRSEVLGNIVNPYFGTDQSDSTGFLKFKGSPSANLTSLNNQLVNVYYGKDFSNISGNKFIDWTKYNSNALANDAILTSNQLTTYKSQMYYDSFNINKSDIHTKMFDTFLLASTVNYLIEPGEGEQMGDKFMEALRDQVIYGRDFYFVWADGLNGKLEDGNKAISSRELLNVNRMKVNNNNDYSSKYFSNSGTLLTANADGDNLYNSSTYGIQSNHYDVMKPSNSGTEMLGYVGLQSSERNSLPSIVVDKLFNSQREGADIATTSKGVLYQYGSRAELISHIEDIKFISDIETLANNISKELGGSFDLDSINKATTIALKKEEFIKQFDVPSSGDPVVPEEAFHKFENYVSDQILPDTSTVNFYGAYAKQINYNDVSKDFVTFLSEQGSDIVFNLLITTAMNERYRNIVLNEITANNKFNVYDLNAQSALSPNWIVEDEDEEKK